MPAGALRAGVMGFPEMVTMSDAGDRHRCGDEGDRTKTCTTTMREPRGAAHGSGDPEGKHARGVSSLHDPSNRGTRVDFGVIAAIEVETSYDQ